ncbi:RNA-binding protein [Skeletonema marinoi]|uniref:RNA-binding protein n=1 Tax=Skeletonema marinoi TaxID=267567 RepID=A0AAD8YP87_9STRA|nr:RNA-binding protein [Skeletonema marinoi]
MGEENSSTRICIKNVPPSFDEAKLKSYLQSGQPSLKLTDCKLLKTKDGRSRKIAFVGFKTHDMAQTAVSYFDRSFALTSRLGVSFAFSKKDGKDDYRPWSKHSAGSSRNQKDKRRSSNYGMERLNRTAIRHEEESQAQSADEPEHIRRKREEFLSAMGITTSKNKNDKSTVSKSKFWANDDAAPDTEQADVVMQQQQQQQQQISNDENGAANASDDEAAAIVAAAQSRKKKNDDDDESDDSSSDSDSSDDSSDEDTNKDTKAATRKDVAVADVKQPQNVAENVPDAKPADSTAERQEVVGDRLFVRNLPFTTTEEELMEMFSQVGAISSVHIPVDDTKKNKGYGFVTFQSKRDAKNNRPLLVKGGRKQYQKLASKYPRGDAVVDNLSDRLNMSKGEVLDVKDGISSGNAAVRLALGETHIIAENREFFLKHGVDVTLTEKDSVKQDLTKVFHAIGGDPPSQILLPPSKTAALVEYGHATMLVELFADWLTKKWAPLSKEAKEESQSTPRTDGHVVKDVVDKDLKSNALSTNETADESVSQIPTKAAPAKKSGAAGEPQSMGYGFLSAKSLSSKVNVSAESKSSSKNTKIMVRNVPFEATRSELLKLFGAFGQLKKVRLPKKIDGTHRGFAFCEFLTNKEAKNAMTTLSGRIYGDDKMNVTEAREKAKRDAMKAGLGDSASGAGKKKGRHTKF